jgi:hypothetical protein
VRQFVASRTVAMGTEELGVIEVVRETSSVGVRVTRGEGVPVAAGLGALDVREGVRIACNVSAAAV